MHSFTTYLPAFVFSLLGLSFLLIIGAGGGFLAILHWSTRAIRAYSRGVDHIK